jgi:hypothetical protein
MNLKMVYQMCLTNNLPKPKLCYVKTIACEAVQVNEGNDKLLVPLVVHLARY